MVRISTFLPRALAASAIAAALMVPIVAIGVYPKLLTETYDATTVNIAQQARNALPIVAQNRSLSPVSMVPTLEPSVLK